jgi:hypothetical protein
MLVFTSTSAASGRVLSMIFRGGLDLLVWVTARDAAELLYSTFNRRTACHFITLEFFRDYNYGIRGHFYLRLFYLLPSSLDLDTTAGES